MVFASKLWGPTWKPCNLKMDPLLRTFQEDEPLHGPYITIYFLCISDIFPIAYIYIIPIYFLYISYVFPIYFLYMSYIFPIYLLFISLHNPTQAWLFCWGFGQKWDPAALLHDMAVPTARIWLVQSSARLSSRQALASDAASLSNFMMLIYVNVSNRCSMIFWHNTWPQSWYLFFPFVALVARRSLRLDVRHVWHVWCIPQSFGGWSLAFFPHIEWLKRNEYQTWQTWQT